MDRKQMPHGHYIIRGGAAGRERLRILSRVMAPTTTGLLAPIGISEGARCLDAGCGGGDVALELARLAGPGGRVTGIDLDDIKVTIARDEALKAGVSNVCYRHAGLDGLGERSAFDVAYARFLLSHLPDPAQAVRTLAQATRPGGVVAVEDVDFAGCFSHPASAAYATYCDLFTRASRARGVDPNIGPRLPAMFLAAGLTDVGMHVVQPAGFDPDIKALSPLTLENIADSAAALGLISRQQVDALIGELYAFAAEPSTILSLPRVFQVWGTTGSGTSQTLFLARAERESASWSRRAGLTRRLGATEDDHLVHVGRPAVDGSVSLAETGPPQVDLHRWLTLTPSRQAGMKPEAGWSAAAGLAAIAA